MQPAVASLLVVLPLLIVFLVLSLLKTTLRSLSPIALQAMAETAGPRRKRMLQEYVQTPTEFILHLQWLVQVCLAAMTISITGAFVAAGTSAPLLWAFVATTALILALEHFVPRYVMSVDREALLYRLLPAYVRLEPLARRVGWLATRFYRHVLKERVDPGNGGEPSEEEIRAFIDVGERAGILEGDEGDMLESLVDFGDTVVREVMTPRVDMDGIEVGATIADARDLMIQTRHSRLPVFRERVDSIEGVIYIKDLVDAWRDGKEREPVESWMRTAVFVPDTKKVADLLRDFQRNHQSFAIVVDEHGGTSGLITVEDLVEEIVGEITEEHDQLETEVIREDDGSYLISAKIDLEKLEEILGLEVEEASYGTLAGLVFATLGRVPEVGEAFSHAGLRFTVVDADRRRVNQVRVSPIEPQPADEPVQNPS